MKNKYNIALTPATNSDVVVSVSQEFSSMADKYLLGNDSYPHVTLYQFEAEEEELDKIWDGICNKIGDEPIDLRFEKFSCVTFNNNVYWVSLMPDAREALSEMHNIVADVLKLPIKKTYDPHMTLINTKNKNYEMEVNKYSEAYVPINDSFVLTLGKCDEIGQLTEVICKKCNDK